MTTTTSTEVAISSTESIRDRMAQIRQEAAVARANDDFRTVCELDGELTYLGQRLRNLRPIPHYPDDRCCASCR